MASTTVREIAHALGFKASTVANKAFTLLGPSVRKNEARLRSDLQKIAGTTTTGATAYFVYLGKTTRRLKCDKVLFNVTTGGASTQAGEVGLFSSPTAPNGAAQTLTCLAKDATLDDLTGTGVKGNTTAMGYDVPADTHLWAGYRVDMASTEPTVVGLTGDNSEGTILSLAAQSAFAVGSTYAGDLITAAFTWQAPALVVTVS